MEFAEVERAIENKSDAKSIKSLRSVGSKASKKSKKGSKPAWATTKKQ